MFLISTARGRWRVFEKVSTCDNVYPSGASSSLQSINPCLFSPHMENELSKRMAAVKLEATSKKQLVEPLRLKTLDSYLLKAVLSKVLPSILSQKVV